MAGENIDIFVLENVNGVITQRFTPAKDIDNYLKIIEQEEAEEKLKSDKNKGGDLFA